VYNNLITPKKERYVMVLIKAIMRPEKSSEVISALYDAGFSAVTKMSVDGRGNENSVTADAGYLEEQPKTLLYIVCEDSDKNAIVDIIMTNARTGEHGDGKIFISAVEEAYTISTGEKGL